MHKIFAGLRDAHLHAENAAALDVLAKLADWTAAATAPMNDAQFQRMLDTEHGGMNEVLADVSALTGDSELPGRSRGDSATRRCSRRSPTRATRSTAFTRTRRSRRSSASSASTS